MAGDIKPGDRGERGHCVGEVEGKATSPTTIKGYEVAA
jgi:hypothetical protein